LFKTTLPDSINQGICDILFLRFRNTLTGRDMKLKVFVLILVSLTLINLGCKKKINPALNKPLLEAFRAGDLNKVKELVCGSADINADVDGYRSLV
jgi:hypothetical protein